MTFAFSHSTCEPGEHVGSHRAWSDTEFGLPEDVSRFLVGDPDAGRIQFSIPDDMDGR